MELWKKYIAFEKSNPLRSEDTALVTRRVMFATEQCLLVQTHHPAVWHQAAQYLDQSSKLLVEKGVRIFSKISRNLSKQFFILLIISIVLVVLYNIFHKTLFDNKFKYVGQIVNNRF